MIDLRSDTLTQPTPEMRAAIAAAPVGDDVFSEDPSVNALQELIADRLGKEAALFVPSGSMSNQIGIRVHCAPGDEFICEEGCHIYNYEQGAYAQLSGVAVRPVIGTEHVLRLEDVEDLVRGENEHLVTTRMLTLENTHNRGSGRVLPYDGTVELCRWAHNSGLTTHLDGARLFNAMIASGIDVAQWAEPFDTVSVCFSKGLGAPVGSALAGPRDLIRNARRHRKAFGGAMRQAGILAAAAVYALENHVDRLAEDHSNAQILAAAIRDSAGLRLTPEIVDSNIVFFEVDPRLATAKQFADALKQQNVLALSLSKTRLRVVTHLDVSTAQVRLAAEMIHDLAADYDATSNPESLPGYSTGG